MSALLRPSGRVLPTLNQDGSRRLIRPRLFRGRYFRHRRVLAYVLIAVFALLPWLHIAGKPSVLLDIPGRKFILFGSTFLATDGALLMLLMLSIFVGVFLVTAWVGRAWCGWACPQTVYLEFLFRPLEAWLEGGRAAQARLDKDGFNARRVLKYVVFAVLSVVVANVFLSYFVGTERLVRWMTRSPFEHPGGFLVLTVTAGLVFFDFAYFREQMCTVICPYARLQSVLLDKSSSIIGYDRVRGEPRGRGEGKGDCIDCGACVVTCPTGIDIRQGLQLECIACAQCVDACDSVMKKLARPLGLIGYTSQSKLEQPSSPAGFRLRPRLVAYGVLFAALAGALVVSAARGGGVDVTLLRDVGAPFSVSGRSVLNQLHVKLQNRGSETAHYNVELIGADGVELRLAENPVAVPGGERVTLSVVGVAPLSSFENGRCPVLLRVRDEHGVAKEQGYVLLGPSMPGGAL